MSPLGVGLILVFLALSGLHFYWGVGGFWPGHDADSLRLRVVGTPSGPMFGFTACALVAASLLSGAAIVWAAHSKIMAGGIAWAVCAGYAAMILVFGLRGLAPYVTPLFDYARGAPFYELNRLYYAPLCLAIAAALTADFPSVLARTVQ